MAGAIQKEIGDIVSELESSPNNHLLAREGILDSITLTREFAQTMLNAVCEQFTSSTFSIFLQLEDSTDTLLLDDTNLVTPNTSTMGEVLMEASVTNASYSLATICERLARQRAICYGARDIQTAFKKFIFPTYEVVNGALGLTEPNTSFMGLAASQILDEYQITLSTTPGTTQTEGSNTFSTYVGDYYLVRSRVDGELVDVTENIAPYTTPDAEIVFGNTITWGGDVSGEAAANTWNYNWAKANIATVNIINAGAFNELTTLTLDDHLTPGSNNNYTPVGPSFGGTHYLKRHEDSVNTFTITGTATANTQEITEVSDEDMAKVKHGDVITSSNLPIGYYGPTKILAAKAAENKIRLSDLVYDIGTVTQEMNTVTLTGGTFPLTTGIDGAVITFPGGGGTIVSRPSGIKLELSTSSNVYTQQAYSITYGGKSESNGVITYTINSVPFSHAKNDIFCQVKITAEGIVKNDNWKPIGDGVGGYSGTDEGPDDTLTANTSQFIGLLGFYDPNNGSANATNDLTKAARDDFSSLGKEYNEIYYPYVELNPFKPAIGPTNKSYAVENGELTGTQPPALGDQDAYSGRYIRWDNKRADASGALPEHRYYTDSAEKFYYELPANAGYTSGTSSVANWPMPAEGEPPHAIDKSGLSGVVTRIQSTTVSCDGVSIGVGAAGTIPVDDNTTTPSLSGTTWPYNDTPSAGQTIGHYYTKGANNYIYDNHYRINTVTVNSGSNTWVATTRTDVSAFVCRYNFAQKHIYESGGNANTTMNADVQFIRDTVGDLQSIVSFRDPIISGAEAGGSGISDADFDTYLATEPYGDLASLSTSLTNYRNALVAQGRTGQNNGNSGKGTAITYSNSDWSAFHTEVGTFGSNCGKRVAEIDARIGVPTRAGTRAQGQGVPPAIYVSGIPSSNTTGGQVPYGKSLYNNVNHLLGKDIDLLGKLIGDVQSLSSLIDLVKKARNKFEIYNGRDKEYSDV